MKWLISLALIAGCSSSSVPTKPEDETLRRLGHAGEIAYNLEQPEQAVEQYRAALERARERDDVTAIDDAGFNLATAKLRADKPQDAMRTARELQAELARRGTIDPYFDLIIATALFRLNKLPDAGRVAATLTTGNTPKLADPAWFLLALIADAKGDSTTLRQAAASLSAAADAGDRAEVRARIDRDPARALHAADLRRDALDYRGMARDLGLAARFTPDAATSADLYLRAGRSAAAQHDAAQARFWLSRASARATNQASRDEADQALRELPTTH